MKPLAQLPCCCRGFPFHWVYTSKSFCICTATLTLWQPVAVPLSPMEGNCALAHLLPAASDNSVCRWVTGWKGCAFKNIKCVWADCACVYNPLLLIRDNSEVSRGGERGQGLTFWAVVSPAGRLTHTSVSGAVGYYFSPAKSALLCHHESVWVQLSVCERTSRRGWFQHE